MGSVLLPCDRSPVASLVLCAVAEVLVASLVSIVGCVVLCEVGGVAVSLVVAGVVPTLAALVLICVSSGGVDLVIVS